MSHSGPCGAPFAMVMTVAHHCEPVSAHYSQVQHGSKSRTEGLLECFTAFLSPLVGVLVLVVVGSGSSGKAVEPKKAAVEALCPQTSRYVQFCTDPDPQPCVRYGHRVGWPPTVLLHVAVMGPQNMLVLAHTSLTLHWHETWWPRIAVHSSSYI